MLQEESSLQHLRFTCYLKYRKCCIFYFVIQLLSEPDKHGWLVQKSINLIQDTKLLCAHPKLQNVKYNLYFIYLFLFFIEKGKRIES